MQLAASDGNTEHVGNYEAALKDRECPADGDSPRGGGEGPAR